jgi:hypothetical protein
MAISSQPSPLLPIGRSGLPALSSNPLYLYERQNSNPIVSNAFFTRLLSSAPIEEDAHAAAPIVERRQIEHAIAVQVSHREAPFAGAIPVYVVMPLPKVSSPWPGKNSTRPSVDKTVRSDLPSPFKSAAASDHPPGAGKRALAGNVPSPCHRR